MRFINVLFLIFLFSFSLKAQLRDANRLSIDPGNPDALYVEVGSHMPGQPFASPSFLRSVETRQDSTHEFEWDTLTGAWNLQYRYLHSYAGGPNVVSSLYQRMEAGEWLDYVLYTLVYDDQDNLVDYIEQYWNGIEWRNTYRYTYTYDGNNNRTEEVLQDWNVNAWKNFYQIEYAYDSNQNLITQTNREWQAIAWVNSIKREYTFDEHNLITQQIRQDWDSGWENAFRYFYTYDTLNNLTLFYSEKWESNNWAKNYRNEYEYDSLNNRTLLQRQNPAFGNLWSFDYQFVYTYDGQSQLTSETEQDHQSTSWLNVDRYMYAYDADQNQISEVYQEWTDDWLNIDSSFYYYNVITAIEQMAGYEKVVVYPNPSTDFIFIKYPSETLDAYQIEIYSGDGLNVFKATAEPSGSGRYDISQLPPGIYFTKIHGNQKVAIGQFVKT
jgi:truncated hemoglobin YjbI